MSILRLSDSEQDRSALSDQKGAPLDHLLRFFEALNREGIRYCHWKSNVRLKHAMAGETDLDLLVHRDQAQHFRDVALRFDFKGMRSPASKQYPAMEDYLGFDHTTGRFSHLHVHYRLVLGNQYLKSYRLPIEDFFLDFRRRQEPYDVMVPMKEWELVVLVIRILLKTRIRFLLAATLKASLPIPKELHEEIDYLVKCVNNSEFNAVLDKVNPIVTSSIISTFVEKWQKNSLTPWRVILLRSRLHRALAPYRWATRRRSVANYLIQESRSLSPWPFERRKQLITGGRTIAFVGADGAGKSTVVREIKRWLEWKLEVQTFYMGSKQPSWRTLFVKRLFVNSDRLYRLCVAVLSPKNIAMRLAAAIRVLFERILFVALAMDRHNSYRLGCAASGQGKLVLFDRFPLPEVYQFMDGPRSISAENRQVTYLEGIERRLYQSISRPDHIIILQVSPEVSLSRKPDHNFQVVQAKSEALKALMSKNDLNVTHVDADASFSDVLLQVKQVVWGLL